MYIVVECWPDAESAHIVTDKEGINKVFYSLEEAEEEKENCQNGLIVEI